MRQLKLLLLVISLTIFAFQLTFVVAQTTSPRNEPIINKTEWTKEYNAAKKLNRQNPNWYSVLPDCPCTSQEAVLSNQWEEDDSIFSNKNYYHPGAATIYRSEQVVNGHGQQCAYAADGKLITSGSGAGTPDFYAPVLGNLWNHRHTDVLPFKELGWRIYNQLWVPNTGASCPANHITPISLIPAGSLSDINPVSLPKAHLALDYSQQISVNGGTGNYTYTVTGALPNGIKINNNGLISGKPKKKTANHRYQFTVHVEDDNGFSGSESYSIDVTAPPEILKFILSPMTYNAGLVQQYLKFKNPDGDPISYIEFIGASEGALSGNLVPELIAGNTYKGKLSFATQCWTYRMEEPLPANSVNALISSETRTLPNSFTWDATLVDAEGNRSETRKVKIRCKTP